MAANPPRLVVANCVNNIDTRRNNHCCDFNDDDAPPPPPCVEDSNV